MDWLLSGLSIAVLWLMGNKTKWAPVVGLITQVVWIVYVFRIGEMGLMVGVLAYTAVHARNAYKWWKTN